MLSGAVPAVMTLSYQVWVGAGDTAGSAIAAAYAAAAAKPAKNE